MNNFELARKIKNACEIEGAFKLRSGKVVNQYFDKYLFESSPELLREVSGALESMLEFDFDAVAGLELGAIPIATLVSQISGKPLLLVRKNAKDYGTRKVVEGNTKPVKTVVVVEDIATTGGAIEDGIRQLKKAGLLPVHVACVIDRESGAQNRIEGLGCSFSTVTNKSFLDSLV